MKKNLLVLIVFLLACETVFSQKGKDVDWLSFEQLEDSLRHRPKMTFLYFTADWCVYCKKMDRYGFKNPEVVQRLNSKFYAVKMNVESLEPIFFDGQLFHNKQAETQRNGIHQLALLLAGTQDQRIIVPAIIILDKDFRQVRKRSEYLSSQKLLDLLNEGMK